MRWTWVLIVVLVFVLAVALFFDGNVVNNSGDDLESESLVLSNARNDSQSVLFGHPGNISGYDIYQDDIDAGESCVVLGGVDFCFKEGKLEFLERDEGDLVLINSVFIFEGAAAYADYTKARADSISGGVYAVEDGKGLAWFFGSDDVIIVRRFNYSDGRYDRFLDVDESHPVVEYFLKEYPPVDVGD